ncbi:uncharacterized protein J4E78_005734 [Alternaria triticimaculans]|uniref:uncharacterized protein n=1 Tax=Alternaria triticimaculans TaxID=297637 RepID=UPI0020C238B3|nr:uncharacterized protein J4E78_005734 [Alternaria triticimaculans]KAI4659307.1 hypothetical protein J4E78_005734 [Alternaria triticimaculans]
MSLTSSAAVCQATPVNKPFNFVALPLEVKELIYKHAMFAGGHLCDELYVYSGILGNALKQSFPAICFTNKLERIIASRLYLRYQTIVMHNSDDSPVLEAFLSQFGKANEGLRWLKHVEFANLGDFCDFSKAVPLIKVCTALKTVVFHMISDHLYEWEEEGLFQGRPSTGTEIFERLRLHGLSDCGHLTKVRFSVWGGRHAELEGLKELIQDFSCAFLALYGLTASKKLDVDIEDEHGLIWVLEPQV